jgi:hypothetical protein
LCLAEPDWVPLGVEIQNWLASLPGRSWWQFNATRGPEDLWMINFTVSGTGFSPTVLIVCDDPAYSAWLDNGSTTGCLLIRDIDWAYHTQLVFPHVSLWHLVLQNTGGITLLYSLTVTRYQRATTTPPTTTNLLNRIAQGVLWVVVVGVVVLVVLPWACGCRRRSRR